MENNFWSPIKDKTFSDKPWCGSFDKKPWDYNVTVVIPVLDSFNSCFVIKKILNLQTEIPYIIFIDTGSDEYNYKKMETLRSNNCEVHSLRMNGVKHPSDYPAIAMDLAFSMCRTAYLLATHADVFFQSRLVVEELLNLCYTNTVVGYELTERPHSDWSGMVSHTLTMFDMKIMDKIGASWSLRRLLNTRQHPDGKKVSYEIGPYTSPNWPDTELLINYILKDHNIKPLIIGSEKNAERTLDHRIDHCRSWVSSQIYDANSNYAIKSNNWLINGINKSIEKIKQWENEL